jgi:hypothetical protein
MARVDRDYIERLAQERFQGRYREEFLRALDQLTADFAFEDIARMIEVGDIEGAVQAVGLEPENFANVAAVTSTAVTAAGQETGKIIPVRQRGNDKIKFVFRPGNPRAEAAVDMLNTGLMRGLNGGPAITEEGKRAVREHIRRGLQNGENPRKIARRMRGTWDKAAGAYRGGMIGLTDTQARHVANAEAQLRSGDPTQLRKYLGRKLRDKRFDRTVLKAIREGTPLSEEQIDKMVKGYTRKYVKFRSETVARDQALSALTEGQQQALDQAVQDGHVRNDEIVQEWRTAADDRVRNAHRAIPRMNPGGKPRGEPFDTLLGPLRYPRDPQGSRANTIQCRCALAPRIRRRQETVDT